MNPERAPAAAPRWPTLLALATAVAGAHLALLLGPVSWNAAAALASARPTPTAIPASDHDDRAMPTPVAPRLPVAQVSTVRWIVPAPVAVPAAAPLKPPRAAPPTRPAAPRREARTDPPPVVAEAAPDVPPAIEVPLPAPAPESASDNADIPPTETLALADTTTPAPAPVPAPAPQAPGIDDTAPDTDDELLAAAAVKKRTPPAATRSLPPAQPPASTRLDYAVTGRIKGIAYNAEGQLDWALADGRYSARMEMKVFLLGSRVQTSTGQVGPAGLSPERFADKSRSEKAAHFDAVQKRVRFSNNAPDAVLLPGAQDRLSLFLQIAGLLQARPQAYTSGQTIEMPVVGTGDADLWRFEVGDEVTLSLPAGEMRARQIRRLPRKEFDSTVEMWLAPALQHLPVRLRVTQANGDVADQQLSRLP